MSTPLSIGGYHYPPFMDEHTQKGLYITLAQAIEKQSGLEFQWKYYPYARLDGLFSVGKLQLEIGSSPSWHMHKVVPGLFTDDFYELEDVAVYRTNTPKLASKMQDIQGQKIGIVRGYSFPQFTHMFEKKLARKVESNNEYQLLNLLLNERVDQVFISKQVFLHLQQQNPKFNTLTFKEVVGRYKVAIRVHPDAKQTIPRLNQAIESLKRSGAIKAMFSSPP